MTRIRSKQFLTRPSLQALEARALPSFLPPLNYPFASTQYGTKVVDVTGDRRPDVVVAAYSLDAVAVFRGDGTGHLDPEVKLHAIGNNPVELRVVDLNADGKRDVVTTNDVDSSNPTIGVLLGAGFGTFQPATQIPMPAGNRHFTVGDFNRDGRLDVATSDGPHQLVNVWKGNGDGTLQPPKAYAGGPGAFGIHTGDLNGDEWPDITTVNPSAGKVHVLLNRGDGSFKPHTAYAAGSYPFGHDVGDINADGRADVVVSDFYANKNHILLANPEGTLQPMLTLPSGPLPFYPLLGDFNRDGRVDFATPQYGNSTVGVFLGNGDGTFGPHTEYGVVKTDLRSMAVGDLNNDRFTDVAVPTGYGGAGSMNILRNDAYWPPPAPPFGRGHDAVSLAAPAVRQQSGNRQSALALESAHAGEARSLVNKPLVMPVRKAPIADGWINDVFPGQLLVESVG